MLVFDSDIGGSQLSAGQRAGAYPFFAEPEVSTDRIIPVVILSQISPVGRLDAGK